MSDAIKAVEMLIESRKACLKRLSEIDGEIRAIKQLAARGKGRPRTANFATLKTSIVGVANRQAEIRVSEMASLFGVTRQGAEQAIVAACESGCLRKIGRGRFAATAIATQKRKQDGRG